MMSQQATRMIEEEGPSPITETIDPPSTIREAVERAYKANVANERTPEQAVEQESAFYEPPKDDAPKDAGVSAGSGAGGDSVGDDGDPSAGADASAASSAAPPTQLSDEEYQKAIDALPEGVKARLNAEREAGNSSTVDQFLSANGITGENKLESLASLMGEANYFRNNPAEAAAWAINNASSGDRAKAMQLLETAAGKLGAKVAPNSKEPNIDDLKAEFGEMLDEELGNRILADRQAAHAAQVKLDQLQLQQASQSLGPNQAPSQAVEQARIVGISNTLGAAKDADGTDAYPMFNEIINSDPEGPLGRMVGSAVHAMTGGDLSKITQDVLVQAYNTAANFHPAAKALLDAKSTARSAQATLAEAKKTQDAQATAHGAQMASLSSRGTQRASSSPNQGSAPDGSDMRALVEHYFNKNTNANGSSVN